MADNQFKFFPSTQFKLNLLIESEDLQKKLKAVCSQMGFQPTNNTEENTLTVNVSLASSSKLRQFSYASGQAHVEHGNEMIFTRANHKVYYFQNVGVLIFSRRSLNWNLYLNASESFWADSSFITKIKTFFARVISFALEKTDIIGLFGVPIDKGMVLMSPFESKGEFVFFDINENEVLTREGVRELSIPFKVIKLEETLREEERKLPRETFLSFLTNKTTHFSTLLLPQHKRKALRILISHLEGYGLSRKSFNTKEYSKDSNRLSF